MKGLQAFVHWLLEIITRLVQIAERVERLSSPLTPQNISPPAIAPSAEDKRLAEEKSRELRRTMFTEYRDHLWTLRQSNIEHSDNLILTLSSAILGLSISFVKDIVPLARAAHLWCLVTSWSLLVAAIMSTLVSYWSGRRNMDLQIHFAEQYYLHERKEYFNKANCWKKITGWCNMVSGWTFSAGVVLLVYFVSLNLFNERGYQNKLSKTSLAPANTVAPSLKGGASPP